MKHFAKTITAEDCAGLTGQSEKTQYKNKHKSRKIKGGSPPKDYTAVEMLIDFKQAMKEQNFEEAVPLYYSLKRLLGY